VTPIRLGAVGYLNARPLVYGLDRDPRFAIRYDIPAECARLLHGHDIDCGLVPSIEFLRGPHPYELIPGPAVTSDGPVASVAIYTRKEPHDIRSIAMDSSSRTSVALATILMRRVFGVAPEPLSMSPDLDAMLARADAALIIGDVALFLDADARPAAAGRIQKIDLGALWKSHTGLPFVYACWTAWTGAVDPDAVERLQRARDEGVAHVNEIAAAHCPGDSARQQVVRAYLRDNIQYALGEPQIEGLKTFYRYAAELGLVSSDGSVRFSHAVHHGAR
jgi:chorismate dehydratase